MCVVAGKYLPDFGWVGGKNRDRNYKTEVKLVQSNRKGIQRLYIDDAESRWTEGVNEFGLCILSASLTNKEDEQEFLNFTKKRSDDKFSSVYGKIVRDALFEKTPKEAIDTLVENKMCGATLCFNEEEMWVNEAYKNLDTGEIFSKSMKVSNEVSVVRTNHGIILPEGGFDKNSDDEFIQAKRKSSENRLKIVKEQMKNVTMPKGILAALSHCPEKDTSMNPIRHGDISKNEMITTGQLLLIPKERLLTYRPIHSSLSFNFEKLNNAETKTYFEVVSNRDLLTFKKFLKSK